MNCTKHLFSLQWDHHDWRPHVLSTEYVPTVDTNMWGRPVTSEFVRCRKQYVCKACGKTRADVNCVCDKAEGDRCAIRLACLGVSKSGDVRAAVTTPVTRGATIARKRRP